jgi:hypothetical protein
MDFRFEVAMVKSPGGAPVYWPLPDHFNVSYVVWVGMRGGVHPIETNHCGAEGGI